MLLAYEIEQTVVPKGVPVSEPGGWKEQHCSHRAGAWYRVADRTQLKGAER